MTSTSLPPFLRHVARSISTVPVLIAAALIALAFLQLRTAYAPRPALPDWLAAVDLQDLDTIRGLLATVIGGVFTLAVFAYTMVMTVIDRAIQTYSARLLPLLTSQRYHQVVMGIAAGTIAYCVILYLGVGEGTSAPPHPPVLAAAGGALFALVSLFSYLYFINRVSLGIHINRVLYRSYRNTSSAIGDVREARHRFVELPEAERPRPGKTLSAVRCGYLTAIDYPQLASVAGAVGAPLLLLPTPGTFVYAGQPVLAVGEGGRLSPKQEARAWRALEISPREPMDVPETGFKHLVEVAIKAASPGINDQGTSLAAIHYLVQCFRELAALPVYNAVREAGGARGSGGAAGVVWVDPTSLAALVEYCFAELRAYLADDPWGSGALHAALGEIMAACLQYDRPEGVDAAQEQLRALVK